MEGVVKEWNSVDWRGLIESEGKSYIVKRQNMKRGTKLTEGMLVGFIPVNLLEGPTAQNVQPITQKSQQ